MHSLILNLIAVIVLLVANGFFVAAEFSLVKARGFRLEIYALEGSSAAKLTLRIQSNLEAYLAACQRISALVRRRCDFTGLWISSGRVILYWNR